MRSYLVSATSLAALLALDPMAAQATTYWTLSDIGCTSSATGCTMTFYALPGQATVGQTATLTVASGITLTGTDTFNVPATTTQYSGTQKVVNVSVLPTKTVASDPYTFTGQSAANGGAGSTGSSAAAAATATVTSLTPAQTSTLTFQGYTVAPIQTVSGGGAGYVLVTSSGTAAVTITNTGSGGLAGTGTAFNLNGSVNALGSSNGFTGPSSGGTVSLTGSGAGHTSSAVFTYTFAPTITGAASTTASTSFSNGNSSGTNSSQIVTTTLTGTGVAPVESVAVTNAAGVGGTKNGGALGYVLVNGASASATVTVQNSGNGNLAGSGGAFNLNGSVTTQSGTGYSGSTTPATVSLNDTNYKGGGATLSSAYTYTFAPTVRGVATTVVTTSFANGSNNGQNLANSVITTITAQGVAPVQSTTNGGLGNAAASGGNPYVLVGSGQTAAAVVTLTNVGDGNLAGTGTNYNLNGSASISGTGFSGSGTVSLNDANYGGAGPTISQTVTYVFQPTATGAASGVATLAYTNGNSNQQNTAQTLNYTYTGTGVAPVATMTGGGAYGLVGNTASVTVTVNNTGNGNLSGLGTISNLQGSVNSASGGNASLFSGGPTSLNGGTGVADTSSTTVSYVFAPTTIGTFSTNVTGTFTNGATNGAINTNSGGTQTVAINGTGVAPADNVSTANPNYVLVKSSATSTVIVTNSGNGNLSGLGTISNLLGSAGAASSSVFTGGGGSINLADGSLTAGATTANTFTYDFAPTVIGAATGTVTLTFANGIGPTNSTGTVTVTVGGTGVAPIQTITTSGTIGNNGYVLVQQTAAATVTIQNIGNGNLAGAGSPYNLDGSISNSSGAGFSGGVNGGNSTISLNDSNYGGAGATITQTYSYTFAPTMVGAATTTLTASFANGSNHGDATGHNNAQTVVTTLAGTGVAPINTVTTTAVGNNGYVLVQSSGTATATIQNIGNGNLSGQGAISNLNGSVSNTTTGTGFGPGQTSSVTLNDGATQTYSYTFTPTIAGQSAATTLTASFSNGSNNGVVGGVQQGYNTAQTVAGSVAGTGVAPINTVSATNNGNLGYVLVNGGSASTTVTVNNTGNGNLSGLGTISNLNGSVGTVSGPVFNGNGNTLSLQDSTNIGGSTTAAFTYTFTPTIRGAVSTTVVSSFTNGSAEGENNAASVNTLLSGTGVAPINSVTATNAGTVRIGTTGTGNVTVNNIGDGNLSGAGPISNLNGSVSGPGGSPTFTAAGGNSVSLSLTDGGSTLLTYTYAPTAHETNTAAVTTAFTNGDTSGQNLSQSVSSTIVGTGVGPAYASPKYGFTNNGTTITSGNTAATSPIANEGTVDAPTIDFHSLTVANTASNEVEILLNITNATSDSADGELTELSLLSEDITGGSDPSAFSVGTFTADNVLQVGDSTFLQLFAYDNLGASGGDETAYLTITTDQDVAFGAPGGDEFTYELAAMSNSTVPEPASLAVLGVGLLGMGWLRWQRKRQSAGDKAD